MFLYSYKQTQTHFYLSLSLSLSSDFLHIELASTVKEDKIMVAILKHRLNVLTKNGEKSPS